MRPLEAVASWPGSLGLAVVVHLAATLLPVEGSADGEPLEFIDFELAPPPPPAPVVEEVVEPPPPPPPPPEETLDLAAGARNPRGEAGKTSVQSNRPDDETPDQDVPIVTGLALSADQLVEGGMAVRVGNTDAPGFEAPENVPVEALRGFEGGGAGGGGTRGGAAGIDEPPRILRTYAPDYPKELVGEGVEGTVKVLVQVLPNGRAGTVEVLRGVHPVLDDLAIDAVRRFRWRAARRAGERVAAHDVVDFSFRIEG